MFETPDPMQFRAAGLIQGTLQKRKKHIVLVAQTGETFLTILHPSLVRAIDKQRVKLYVNYEFKVFPKMKRGRLYLTVATARTPDRHNFVDGHLFSIRGLVKKAAIGRTAVEIKQQRGKGKTSSFRIPLYGNVPEHFSGSFSEFQCRLVGGQLRIEKSTLVKRLPPAKRHREKPMVKGYRINKLDRPTDAPLRKVVR